VFSGANWLDQGDYEAAMAKEVEENEVAVNAPYFRVLLKPGSQIRLDLGMKRFVNRPSYDLPWAAE
jgi:hypothetical protein